MYLQGLDLQRVNGLLYWCLDGKREYTVVPGSYTADAFVVRWLMI
jgi:hypothetical protein